MADIRMLDLSKELNYTDEQKARFESNARAWDEESRAFDEAVRQSETVTEQDLAVRINARDDRDAEESGTT